MSEIPKGMKAWNGGDSAPADWNGGRVWLGPLNEVSQEWAGSDIAIFSDLVDWRHDHPGIIPVRAYTATTPARNTSQKP